MTLSAEPRDRLRILAVAARPFYPANTGGRIRSSQIFERLARMHDITMLCFTTRRDTPESVEAMRGCCSTLETIRWDESEKFTPRFYAELVASLASDLPYTVWKYRNPAMRDRIRTRLSSGAFDLLLCDFLQPSVNCLDAPFTPKLLFQHNVEAVIQGRQARHQQQLLARAYLRLEAAKLARYERTAAHVFDRCIMVSDEDRRTMHAEYGATNTVSVPTGVDTEYFQPAAEGADPEIIFVGSMDWLPNQDAVRFFIDDILPRIRRVVPATFSVVGRNPPDSIRRLAARPYVRVSGTVDDVRPYLAGAQVVVVPLRIGGGTRIKIFEAMAMGRAVVSTSIGAEGLPVRHGVDLWLADDPQEYADAVVHLLQHPGPRARMREAGRSLVSSQFTWDVVADRFSDICRQTVREHREAIGRVPRG